MPAPSRRENDSAMIEYGIARHHEQLTATATIHVFKARRPCVIDRVEYANTVGLAEDPGNTFKGEVKNGAIVLATLFDTDSDLAGSNSLGTGIVVASPTGSPALANRWIAAGDVIDLVFTEGGTATLPPGDVTVYVREV